MAAGQQVGRLAGRTALITGGGSGIGEAVARRFVAEGASVVIAGRTESKLQAVADSIQRPEQIAAFACDVTDWAQVERLVARSTERLGRIDILVNNAGLNIKERAVWELNPERWQQLVRNNLDGAFYCIKAVLPGMRERRDGLIINISSVAGKRASPLSGAGYSAAKFGLNALSHCLGAEEKDHGIRCSAICPGEVDTPILENRPTPLTAEQRSRILHPDDVAEAVLFVACLPPRASVPELIIKPSAQAWI